MEILTVNNLGYSYAEKTLYEKSSFKLMSDEHMGIVGANGSGKSTLLKLLLGKISQDEGQISWHPKSSVGYIDQYMSIDQKMSVNDFLLSAYRELYEAEKKMLALYETYSETGEDKLLQRASVLQESLDNQGFYNIEHNLEVVIQGLSLTKLSRKLKMNELGQGQKVKVMLAKILLEKPSVLVLDEPTNYLDKEDVAWLTTYLKKYEHAFIVVSHDLPFIQAISSCICDVSFERIEKYHMGYKEFLKLKELKQQTYQSEYDAQQKKIKETEAFIRKNIAGINTKMAQGRRKHLERMEKMREPEKTTPPHITFQTINVNTKTFITLEDLTIGHDKALIQEINLVVRKGAKLVVQGEELVGKTTLLKTISQEIPQISGKCTYHPQAVLGCFSQELVWKDPTMTPIEILANTHGHLTYEDVRRALAKCGVRETLAERPIGTLSGGEQSKVKLCDLTLKSYNVLLFDEPTKHLDKDSKIALQKAIKAFSGSVIVISHDKEFFQDFADQVLVIEDMILRN
ncbi:ABC-F family ATP-binding cassette domain-containing protein [Bacillus wiedmannii]|uniref:ABC-F family ATP-binding cassette domain-containing protein n=1 Tax=Bacillus wiedmannii TaxID=1890302 RepID=UPI003D95D471